MEASSQKTFRALLWKDFRRSRNVLIFSVAIWLFPFFFSLGYVLTHLEEFTLGDDNWYDLIEFCIFSGSFICFIIIPLLVAKVTAGEFGTRSASFMAYLPPSNVAVLNSKTICALLPCVLLPGASLALVYIFDLYRDINVESISVAYILIFGAAWLVGMIIRKALWSMFCGLMAPIVVIWISFELMWNGLGETLSWFSNIALPIGLICYAAGWVYGLRWGRASA